MVLGYYKPRGLVGCIAVVMDILQAGRDRETLPGLAEHMPTMDVLPAFFCPGDAQRPGRPKPPHATWWPSEVVTRG